MSQASPCPQTFSLTTFCHCSLLQLVCPEKSPPLPAPLICLECSYSFLGLQLKATCKPDARWVDCQGEKCTESLDISLKSQMNQSISDSWLTIYAGDFITSDILSYYTFNLLFPSEKLEYTFSEPWGLILPSPSVGSLLFLLGQVPSL